MLEGGILFGTSALQNYRYIFLCCDIFEIRADFKKFNVSEVGEKNSL